MISAVIDNSAAIEFFVGVQPDSALRRHVLTAHLGAPEVFDAEALNTLRKLVRHGVLSDSFATRTLHRVHAAPIARMSHRSLLFRAWELRDSLTAYDACYVALAEQLDVPLLTCDAKLARGHGHQARIELFPTS